MLPLLSANYSLQLKLMECVAEWDEEDRSRMGMDIERGRDRGPCGLRADG